MCNSDMQSVLEIVIQILDIIKFIALIALIVLCTIDLFKMIVSKKEDEIKKLRKGIFWKIFYAIMIYAVPYIIAFTFNTVSKLIPIDYNSGWKECWDLVNQNKNR